MNYILGCRMDSEVMKHVSLYCSSNNVKVKDFVNTAVDTYTTATYKLANAIGRRLETRQEGLGEIKKTSLNCDRDIIDKLRDLATSTGLNFEALLRIIILDHLIEQGCWPPTQTL